MSLDKRQRSRSENRSLTFQSGEAPQLQLGRPRAYQQSLENHTQLRNLPDKGRVGGGAVVGGGARRKTSAELISEAKLFLGDAPSMPPNSSGTHNHALAVGGGVRLVSTRRPITPREPGRVLYGSVALTGRPPSAFSLKYLQAEAQRTPKTPSLEPITANKAWQLFDPAAVVQQEQRSSRRSNSLGSRLDLFGVMAAGDDENNNIPQEGGKSDRAVVPRKLPALEKPTNGQGNGNAKNNRACESSGQMIHAQEALNAYNLLTSRRLMTRSCDVLAQSTTQKLVELLKEHAGLKDCNAETTNHVHTILAELYGRLRRNEKHCKRSFILGGIYGLVESSAPKILLAVAKVVLALHVTGSNLTGACKLIFKVARNEHNDSLFHDSDLLELLIDGLGNASPLEEAEACIYGYGAIRFLTSSLEHEREDAATFNLWHANATPRAALQRRTATAPNDGNSTKSNLLLQQEQRVQKLWRQHTLVQRLTRHGAVQLMVLHLQILNEAGASQQLCGPPLHALFQLSAALRTLADVRQTSDMEQQQQQQDHQYGKCHEDCLQLNLACTHLVRAAEISLGELEVQANIVRTLSVLSEDENCCHTLVGSTGRIAMLLGPCCELFSTATDKALAILSRLGYILGNLMAKYEEARIQFYHNDVAMEYLLHALSMCCGKPLALRDSLGDSVTDVLIKMIRVIANMSVSAEVGTGLGQNHQLGALLLGLLRNINKMQADKMAITAKLQELLNALLGTLHNLCFYQDSSSSNSVGAQGAVNAAGSSLQSVPGELAEALCTTLSSSANDDTTTVEVERVLGNLTRSKQARHSFGREGGIALILQHLVRNRNLFDYESKACAIGVLVNLLGDDEHRAAFAELRGSQQLLDMLRLALAKRDWLLAAIVCQAVWNLFTDTADTKGGAALQCEEGILDELCDLLVDSLDETKLPGDELDAGWEEFAIVAADLFERIQGQLDNQQQNHHRLLPHNVDGSRTAKASDDDDDDDVYIDEL